MKNLIEPTNKIWIKRIWKHQYELFKGENVHPVPILKALLATVCLILNRWSEENVFNVDNQVAWYHIENYYDINFGELPAYECLELLKGFKVKLNMHSSF